MRAPMATAARPGPFARKSHDSLVRDATGDPEHGLKRSVGVLDLTALGIGAVIGTGIFVIIGEAIGDAGPSIIISFALAGVTCLFSAFSYAELASSIPVSGSAYTYGYATLGELVAWIIGWDLILEYGVAVAAVAVGWGGYLQSLLDSLFGINLPTSIAGPPGDGGTVNLPAVFLVLAVAALLIYGVRESARTNTFMVITKVAILIFFIVVGVGSINGDNFSPWAPHGFNGHGRRGRADLLRLHRLRRDLDLRRGGREPQPRPALRDHRRAADLHAALHPRRRRHRRAGAGEQAGGLRRAAGRRAEDRRRRRQLGGRHPLGGRADRHHERDPHRPLRPDADHVRDEPRRPRAALGGQAQPAPDARADHCDLRPRWSPSSPPSCRCRRSPSWSTSARCSPS